MARPLVEELFFAASLSKSKKEEGEMFSRVKERSIGGGGSGVNLTRKRRGGQEEYRDGKDAIKEHILNIWTGQS